MGFVAFCGHKAKSGCLKGRESLGMVFRVDFFFFLIRGTLESGHISSACPITLVCVEEVRGETSQQHSFGAWQTFCCLLLLQ